MRIPENVLAYGVAVIVPLLLALALLLLAAVPSLLIFWLPGTLNERLRLPVRKLTAATMILAFATGFMMRLELEMGVFSMAVAMGVFSALWALSVLPVALGIRWYTRHKR